jgi:hypothetical protein
MFEARSVYLTYSYAGLTSIASIIVTDGTDIHDNLMEQPVTSGMFNGIPQGIEGEGLEGIWPESQDGHICTNHAHFVDTIYESTRHLIQQENILEITAHGLGMHQSILLLSNYSVSDLGYG